MGDEAMPIEQIKQPDTIQINDWLRLKAYNGKHDFALAWYQDQVVYYNSEGITDEKKIPDERYLDCMYVYLDAVGELYFIEVLENGKYRPIGDTAVKAKNPPIVIGEEVYRGKGIGKLVLQTVINRAREVGISKIHGTIVYDYNTASQKLHESLGYKCVGKSGNELIYELEL
jgi:GNAT superfamily N-acetyltransferase